jgi:type II secretory pathway component PulM
MPLPPDPTLDEGMRQLHTYAKENGIDLETLSAKAGRALTPEKVEEILTKWVQEDNAGVDSTPEVL